MENTYLVPESVLQAIGQYLINRPYREVASLVQALEQVPAMPKKKDESDTTAPAAGNPA